MKAVAVNETTASGVLFVKRPPHLHTEPTREALDQNSDDAKLEQICERICRVRHEDLCSGSLAFWCALGQLHHEGRYAASVPSLPVEKRVDGHSFTFNGCPQPLKPLLKDLAFRFPRPLITWDVFSQPPPMEFCDPGAAAGPGSTPSHGVLPQPVQGQPSPTELRDPRVANTVSHVEYPKAAQSRDATQLTLEEWRRSFAGRVEMVESERLYIVRLSEADGEFKLGLVASTGAIIDKCAEGDEGVTEPHMKALWFRRKADDRAHAWGKNPAFEPYGGDGPDRIADELPTASFLVEVTDDDLTDVGVTNKWTEPKLKEAFTTGKLRWIAEQYELVASNPNKPSARPQRKRKQRDL